jgi:hypothetical protein
LQDDPIRPARGAVLPNRNSMKLFDYMVKDF